MQLGLLTVVHIHADPPSEAGENPPEDQTGQGSGRHTNVHTSVTLQVATTEAGINYDTVGTVYRGKNIGSQQLFNADKNKYETFNEPMDFLPDQVRFFNKKVKLVATTFAELTGYREQRACKAFVTVGGFIRGETKAGKLQDSNEAIFPSGQTGVVSCTGKNWYMTYRPQTITATATGFGAIVMFIGGGLGFGTGTPQGNFSVSFTDGTVTAPQGFPGTISTDATPKSYTIEREDERPEEHKCAVPDMGLYGIIHPLCPADADAGQNHTLPDPMYHSYSCPDCAMQNRLELRWICYNTPCGHPEWWGTFIILLPEGDGGGDGSGDAGTPDDSTAPTYLARIHPPGP